MPTSISECELNKVMLIAHCVRESALELVDQYDYGPCYDPLMDETGGKRLGGSCGHCSKVVLDLIRKHMGLGMARFANGGYAVTDDDDYSHNWLLLKDGAILDITATQFNPDLPGVYVTKHDPRYVTDCVGRRCEIKYPMPWRNRLKKLAETKLKELM